MDLKVNSINAVRFLSNNPPSIDNFILKVASRCNLNCTYCYVYNKEDKSWASRPKLLNDDTLEHIISRIEEHVIASRQRTVGITFHGGEPLLLGPKRFSRYCQLLYDRLSPYVKPTFSIQTNGVLINAEWIKIFETYDIKVGISVDGPQEIHNKFRIDVRGKGSFKEVVKASRLLLSANISVTALAVIQLGSSGLDVHRSLVEELGFKKVNYLLPDLSPSELSSIRKNYGNSPCADFLLPILEQWWNSENSVQVLIFEQIARLILGGHSLIDTLGNGPLRFLFIESDGEIEGLDVLKACYNGASGTSNNVARNAFTKVIEENNLLSRIFHGEMKLPDSCSNCTESTTCAGGYIPHRFREDGTFNHSSYWCNDIKLIFSNLREKLEVNIDETFHRRSVLEKIRPLDVLFVPTPENVTDEMCRLACLTNADTLYDLGCGDASVLTRAALLYGCRGFGADLDPQRITEAKQKIALTNLSNLVEIVEKNLFEVDLTKATVVFLYLFDKANELLKEKLLRELQPGSRIVSHIFPIKNWKEDARVTIGVSQLFLYHVK